MLKSPIVVSNEKTLKRIYKAGHLGSHWTRLAVGIGALSIEPFVDYYSNKKLDPDTRKYSVVKTCLKIIIGTATGFCSRFIGAKEASRYFIKLIANPETKNIVKNAIGKNSKIGKQLFNGQSDNLLAQFLKAKNKTDKKHFEEKILKQNPCIAKMSASFGDIVGVVVTALFTMSLDIPLLNLGINKTMAKLFPNITAKADKTKKASAGKKEIANA